MGVGLAEKREVAEVVAAPRPKSYSVSPGQNWGSWKPKKGRKLKLAELPGALAAHNRAQKESDRLRDAAGLERVPENQSVLEWRRRLESGDPGRVRTSTAAPAEPMEELRKAIAARARADARISRTLEEAREAGIAVSELASALGVTRQAVYARLSS